MKKIILIVCTVFIVVLGLIAGGKAYMHSMKPDLNVNEIIVSTSLDADGKPIDVLGQVTDVDITREMKKAYVSIPVNSRRLESSKVIVTYQGTTVDEQEIEVSKAGYVTYCLENIESLESGLYLMAFYDSKNTVNVYAAVEVE